MRRFSQYLLPGIVFQSVLIGGAYATGREIVEYGAKFGAAGVWSILTIMVGFSIMSILTYEFARVTGAYDYRTFVRALIGRFWPLFDLLFIVMVIVIIAVVSAASAHVASEMFGWPSWLGIAIVIVAVGLLTGAGRTAIERFKTIGSFLLYAGYLSFAGAVIYATRRNIGEVFAGGDTSFEPGTSLGLVIGTGVLYVGYNLAALPSTLFTLDRQSARKHAVWAGLMTGLLATVPFALTYIAVLGFYPDESVLGAPVPWLVMLESVSGGALLSLYAVVVIWTLVETCTGLIHALIDRVDVNLKEVGREGLGSLSKGLIAASIIVSSVLLSRIGLIDLVARGYTFMAYGFIALFAVPLMTVGVVKIVKAG